nr:MAG TPA: hypothetical protein [Caudoviricetes sp.]
MILYKAVLFAPFERPRNPSNNLWTGTSTL